MLDVNAQVLSAFLVIFTGYILKQQFIRDESFWNFCETLTCNLLAPLLFALVVNQANFSTPGIKTALVITIVATFVVAVIIFLTKRFLDLDQGLFTSLFQGGLRSNSYLFLAISGLLYDQTGLAVAGVFVACTLVLANMVLILVVTHYGNSRKKPLVSIVKAVINNPLILGTFIGLTLNLLNVHFSDSSTVQNYLHYLGDAATPLNLLTVGAGLSLSIKWQKLSALIYASGLKLVVMPLCTALLLKLCGVTGTVAHIAMLYAAVPCAGNACTISRKIGGDVEAMTGIATWSTVISAVTITVLVSWMQ